MNRRRKLFFTAGALCLGGAVAVACNWLVSQEAPRTYQAADQIPANRVGLLLGCRQFGSEGGVNPFFQARIEAAARLFAAGKIEYVLASGDNHRADYNEPEDMKQALIREGVPAERIFCDYAGFTTLDSISRCKEVFGQTRFTVISQQFHNERALYIARAHGLEAVGFNAEGVGVARGLKTYVREAASRVKAVWDVQIISREPKFLGAPVFIGSASGAL